ncbi:MAG: ADP-glyceromanno-heptose 6-epimerase [Oscillibacter sp.]|nr:ADP-glyceromanno-heptose 6-epimerase [Oscillibacter sp.]MEA4993185.1 ADP-glyceromanno-heptose 6-epimerase [Oscillibacter sp.]
MSIIVTGGAGFIGSCIVRMLNDMGREDLIIVDNIASTEKWKNLRNKKYLQYYNRADFLTELPKLTDEVEYVIHMGACSSTTELDFDYLNQNNFNYSKALWNFCAQNYAGFIYASSAATYGGGEFGFDDRDDIRRLMPLNGYGYSKQMFDLWAQKQTSAPPQHVGFKFFNVYGPNEYCKGSMASVILHGFRSAQETGKIKLFKSYRQGYEDGGQTRDFVYVKDICKVIRFMMANPQVSGLFNLGTGKARTFHNLGCAVFRALGQDPNIEFVEMPESLRPKYQYYTEATMDKLAGEGYREPFYSLEDGVKDYVQNYLAKDFLIY